MIFRDGLFEKKVVLITGGGTGIGKSTAMEFAKLGADVVIASRKLENLEKAAEEIKEKTGRDVLIRQLNVRQEESVRDMFESVKSEKGRVDILVNNAGANFLSLSEELSVRGWNAIIETILLGTFLCSKYACKIMKEQEEGGTIINIGATTGIFGSPFALPSATGKAGLEGLTKTLAAEWGRYNIRVNLVAPGVVWTEGFVKNVGATEALLENIRRNTPRGIVAEPEDIAWAVIFLSSPAARAINGVTLIVDGGHYFAKGFDISF
ncbi:MAG: SDR family oxidoreductase [Candidatus Calescibacterium sp.]|nr:SDR family oxidoreductase [Candidatus Calescibacterium sp.]